MLSEISQVVVDKYHMISSLTGTQSTIEKSKQNVTRDIEVKNSPTVTRGDWGGNKWGEGITGPTIKDTWTKSRGRVEVGEGEQTTEIE